MTLVGHRSTVQPSPWSAVDLGTSRTDRRARCAAVFSPADAPRRFAVPFGCVGARPDGHAREPWSRTGTPHDGRHLRVDPPAHGAAVYRLGVPAGPVARLGARRCRWCGRGGRGRRGGARWTFRRSGGRVPPAVPA
ncbi:hypothetical protein ADK58_09030 [Streptomyces sp. XY152]|nr:hypothetical protein ADK58_09030 [Streptomyces sp. XY152]